MQPSLTSLTFSKHLPTERTCTLCSLLLLEGAVIYVSQLLLLHVRELSADTGRLDSQEFGRKNVEQMAFLSATDGLGARVRTDYISYAVNRFGGTFLAGINASCAHPSRCCLLLQVT